MLRARARELLAAALIATMAVLVAACGGGSGKTGRHAGGAGRAAAPAVQLSIEPGAGGIDGTPERGITVTAVGGKIDSVAVHTGGDRVTGRLNTAGTVWHSKWALNVSTRYTVVATGTDSSGRTVTQMSSFRTLTPKQTFTTEILEGQNQSYGVGMPIVLYFSKPIVDRAAVERALEVRTSRRVVGSWYWDSECGTAPVCAYFRTRHYWHPHTRVSFVGHLNGVEVAPGVYGSHTLTQKFTIGSSLIVVASTATHQMTVYRNGRVFARWPISSGRPGDDTPDGNYLTIEKSNPVDMVGPGYNIEVPYSVRFTWSGDYLHDAYWSVGEQGFTNVSHGCVNMSPTDAAIYYGMAVPGDPVKIVGSPRPGTWDNGWTMWFLSWKKWLKGSALHDEVLAGPHGSSFVSPHRRPPTTAPVPPVTTTTPSPTTAPVPPVTTTTTQQPTP